MHSTKLIEQENLITSEQFHNFKKEITAQIQHLRTIMEIQHKQLDLLTCNRHQNAKEMIEHQRKNQEISSQNHILKRKIIELQSTIITFYSEISKLKEKFNLTKSDTFLHHHYQEHYLVPHHQKNQQKQLEKQDTQNIPHSEQSVKQASGKYLVDQRNTNDIENDDDEEMIECVWYANDKKMTQIHQNHRHNPHGKQFTTFMNDGFLNITKLSGSGFLCPSHSFIHKDCIPLTKISKFSVKKIKIRDIFLIGIGTIYVFGVQNAFRHKQLIAYSSNGYIWLNGDSSKSGKQLKTNQTVQMTIDRTKGTVSWSINDIQLTKVRIPQQMIDKQLYLVIMMFNKDDSLHLYHHS